MTVYILITLIIFHFTVMQRMFSFKINFENAVSCEFKNYGINYTCKVKVLEPLSNISNETSIPKY